jgi:integrase
MHPLDREQARRLLEAAEGDRFEALYVLAVHPGMRPGELLGLKWEDVDLDGNGGSLRVNRALSPKASSLSQRGRAVADR